MKIAILIEKIEHGGIQTIGLGLAKLLNQNGNEIHIVHGENKIGNFSPKIKKFKMGRFISPFILPIVSLKFVFKFAIYLYKNKPDIVHSMGFPMGILASILTLKKIPCIVTSQTRIRRGNKQLNNLLIKNFIDKIILTSNYHKSIFPLNVSPKKLVIIPNMIELDTTNIQISNKKSFNKSNKITLLSVGRLTHGKRVDVFLNIIKKLSDKYENIQGVIVGEGPAIKELILLTKKLNIKKFVNFQGRVDNIFEFFKKSDILLHTTKREIQPMLLIEAGAFGIPVICSNIGGNKTIINHGINGLIPENNKIGEYVSLIEFLINDKRKFKNLSLEAKKIVENRFSSKIIIPEYTKLYKSLLKK